MIRIIQGQRVKVGVAAIVAVLWAGSAAAQTRMGGTSTRAFGSRSWRENGLAPSALPASGNLTWDVRLATDLHLYYWSGSAWVDLTASGSAGPQGPQGPVGPAGPAGADGLAGPQGPQGAQGSVGPQGPQGAVGPAGSDGLDGSDGTDGTNGAQGPQGPAGPQGSPGTAGAQGAQGPQGIQGVPGSDGAPGPVGPAGPVAGSDTQVIFNDAGAAAGDSGLTYAKAADALSVAGSLTTGTVNAGTVSTLSGDLTLAPAAGHVIIQNGSMLLFSTVPGAPKFVRNGAGLKFLDNDDTYTNAIFEAGPYNQGGGSASSFRGIQMTNGTQVVFSNGVDYGRGLGTTAGRSGVSVTDGGSNLGQLNAGRVVLGSQAVAAADDGAGTRPAATIVPAVSFVTCACADANGCDFAVSEVGAVDGQTLRIVSIGPNACGFTDSPGVTELAAGTLGSVVDLGTWDSLELVYVVDRWVQVAASNN